MTFDAEAAFKRLQGQFDAIAAEQHRTNELLTDIREALRLDDREEAKSYLFWRIGEDGTRQRAFDTVRFFADYHDRHGSNGVNVQKSGEIPEGGTVETP